MILRRASKTSPVLVNNFFKLKNFYDKEMTAKENNPVKLIYTNYSKHKTAIFGLIMKYNQTQISIFLNTLACTGYNDTLIIVYSRITPETKKYIISFSTMFEIIMIPIKTSLNMYGKKQYIESTCIIRFYKDNKMHKSIQGSTIQKVDIIQLDFVSGDFRFEIAYMLYMNHFFDEYDILFLTDIVDALFQQDIRMYNFTEGVYVVEEAFTQIKYNPYWLEMYNSNYKPFQDRCELCVGTLILVGAKSFSFLADLHNQIKNYIGLIYKRPNFQGALNYLVYNNSQNVNKSIFFITTSHGIINSIGKFNYHMRRFNKKSLFVKVNSIYDVYYHDKNFLLYNHDLEKIAVIHHTKYLPITKKLTYRGVMNVCKKNLPAIYGKVLELFRF